MARYIHRRFSRRSLESLSGVEPPLVAIATLALVTAEHDFVVIEGLRTLERQRKLYREGASKTLKSKHLRGRAIDIGALAGGQYTDEVSYYEAIAPAFYAAAEQLGVEITWGGEWGWDFGHYELQDSYTWRLS